jgi:hypothetical protein
MKAIIRMEKDMEKDHLSLKMEKNMKVNGRKT